MRASLREQIVETLWTDIATMLPGYMRPQDIVVLDAIPLLPNGKIDRKTLPLSSSRRRSKHPPLQPLDDFETGLAQIWCEILGIESVDASADFFELGGHSLLAARLLARVEAVTGRPDRPVGAVRVPRFQGIREPASFPPSAGVRLPQGRADGTAPCGSKHLRHQQHGHLSDAVTTPQ